MKELSEWVNDDLFITDSYYADEYTVTFKKSGDLTAHAAFEKAGLKKPEGDLGFSWLTEYRLSWKGTPDVPFAVRGLKI